MQPGIRDRPNKVTTLFEFHPGGVKLLVGNKLYARLTPIRDILALSIDD